MKRIFPAILALVILVSAAGCANKAQTGMGVGALAGATIGALTFGDKGLGALVGAGVGALMGYVVGNEWDKYDESKVQGTLSRTKSGDTTSWTNPDTGRKYHATPSPAYVHEGRIYRDVVIKEDGPNGEKIMAKAYRDKDGVWRLKQ